MSIEEHSRDGGDGGEGGGGGGHGGGVDILVAMHIVACQVTTISTISSSTIGGVSLNDFECYLSGSSDDGRGPQLNEHVDPSAAVSTIPPPPSSSPSSSS